MDRQKRSFPGSSKRGAARSGAKMGHGGYLTPSSTTDSSAREQEKKHENQQKVRHGRLSGNRGHERSSSQNVFIKNNETEFAGPAEYLGFGTQISGAISEPEEQLSDYVRFFRRDQDPHATTNIGQLSHSFQSAAAGQASHRLERHPDASYSSSADWAPPARARRLAEATDEANNSLLPLPRQRSTHRFGVIISGSSSYYPPPSDPQRPRNSTHLLPHHESASSRPRVGPSMALLLPSFSQLLSSHSSETLEEGFYGRPLSFQSGDSISSSLDSIRFGIQQPGPIRPIRLHRINQNRPPETQSRSQTPSFGSRHHHPNQSHRKPQHHFSAQSESRNKHLYGAQHPHDSHSSLTDQGSEHRVILPGIQQIVSDSPRRNEREGRVVGGEKQSCIPRQHPPRSSSEHSTGQWQHSMAPVLPGAPAPRWSALPHPHDTLNREVAEISPTVPRPFHRSTSDSHESLMADRILSSEGEEMSRDQNNSSHSGFSAPPTDHVQSTPRASTSKSTDVYGDRPDEREYGEGGGFNIGAADTEKGGRSRDDASGRGGDDEGKKKKKKRTRVLMTHQQQSTLSKMWKEVRPSRYC